MTDYEKRLSGTKAKYPFARWAQSGLEQYTKLACSDLAAVFDSLIQDLAELGEHASSEKKLERFRVAVESLNALNEEDPNLIETGEREDLCELVNLITTAAGLDPEDYGDGEGPASEWRDW